MFARAVLGGEAWERVGGVEVLSLIARVEKIQGVLFLYVNHFSFGAITQFVKVHIRGGMLLACKVTPVHRLEGGLLPSPPRVGGQIRLSAGLVVVVDWWLPHRPDRWLDLMPLLGWARHPASPAMIFGGARVTELEQT
jgi:hypothetical protein